MSSSPFRIAVDETSCFVHNMRTRFPFRFGIVSMTALPHLFLDLRCRIDGAPARGIAAEGLAPKWFTKDPGTSILEDLPGLVRVITRAAEAVQTLSSGPGRSFFALWQELYASQAAWARGESIAPLLANLGVSVVERALLDAICRHAGQPLALLLRSDRLGIDLGAVRTELTGVPVRDILPDKPLRSILARHTVGLGDALTEGDLQPGERVADGLPQTLEEVLAAYRVSHFKIKLFGDYERDRERLRQIHSLLRRDAPDPWFFTLDGNENFESLEEFVADWNRYGEDPALRDLLRHLLFVEQPLHRDVALSDAVGPQFASWSGRPPVVIDESDASLESLPRALALGYDGTSHKNCKGIVKGLANAALLRRWPDRPGKGPLILSAEDLSNVGPVALLQDLAVLANLGIPHAERNGHHYFRGLSMFPAEVQNTVLSHHGDLYRRHPGGFATVIIEDGRMSTASAVDAPFGLAGTVDPARFTPLQDWDPASVTGE